MESQTMTFNVNDVVEITRGDWKGRIGRVASGNRLFGYNVLLKSQGMDDPLHYMVRHSWGMLSVWKRGKSLKLTTADW